MNYFNYNGPFIKMLETIANMLIISFFVLLFSLPVVTIVPSFASGYHTTVHVIFGEGKGHGVFKDFFANYKANLIDGIKLNLIILVAVFFLFVGDYAGWQIYKTGILGTMYFALGILLTFIFATGVIYIIPVLAKFETTVLSYIKLAFYFSSQHMLQSILNVIVLVFLVWVVELFPLALLIVPGLYLDLLRPSCEKMMNEFIIARGDTPVDMVQEEKTETPEERSASDIERELSRKKNRRGKKNA